MSNDVATIEELRRINEELTKQIAVQQQQIEWLKKQLFGRKSEKFDHPDLFTLEEDESKKPEASSGDDPQAEGAEATGKRDEKKGSEKKRSIRRERLPENLPVVVEKEIIPEQVKADPDQWREIQPEHSDVLEKEPGYLYIKRIVRRKFVRIDHPFTPPVIAPAEPKLIENGFWGAGLLSEILANKYLYFLPLYRQEQLYSKRFGIELSRKTMSDAVEQVSYHLAPVVERMKDGMLAGGYLQGDETPVRYLDPVHPKGSALGYLWTYRSARGEVIFDWRTNRQHGNVEKFLGAPDEDEELLLRVLQSDGYEAYDNYVFEQQRKGKKISRAACMAHIRRGFEKSLGQRPELARWFLRQIGRLYDIEQNLREHRAPPELRARIREKRSRRIIDLLEKAIDHLLINSATILPKSNLGKALRYARGQWPAMQVYLTHGEVEIDNNLVENAIRPTAVGKKNHLFFGSPEAGKRSAILYSLLISAQAQGVDPQVYLRDLIERLPTATTSDLDDLTPANWAATYKAAQALEADAEAA